MPPEGSNGLFLTSKILAKTAIVSKSTTPKTIGLERNFFWSGLPAIKVSLAGFAS